jgi:hypothetical protein
VDYRKLAEELGGRAEPQPQTETPAVDYRALAEQYGGVQEEEEKAQSLATGLPKDQIFELPVDTVGKSFADKALDYERDIGYAPSTQLGDIADNPLTIFPFIAERIITSIPDMAAAYAAAPAYVAGSY